jgi:predicted house-cleaning noncanonical NTP pyrophosphatase (MazG superfamily)
MLKFRFAKLVRDTIIDQQISSGATPTYRILSAEEYKHALIDKIIEESREITSAPSGEIASEIADVQQALDDLKVLYKLSDDDIKKAQTAKNEKSGTFKKGVYVDYVELDKDNRWVAYYRKNADRYPEIR